MRVAIAIHKFDIPSVLETYDILSRGLYSHASPTMWNACSATSAYASCYIYRPELDDARSLVQSISDMTAMWDFNGGVGIDVGRTAAARWAFLTLYAPSTSLSFY